MLTKDIDPHKQLWVLTCFKELYECGGGEADYGELALDAYQEQDDEHTTSPRYLVGCIVGFIEGAGLDRNELVEFARQSCANVDVVRSFLGRRSAWNGTLSSDGSFLYVLSENCGFTEYTPIAKWLDSGDTCCVECAEDVVNDRVDDLTAPQVRALLDRLRGAGVRIVRDRIG